MPAVGTHVFGRSVTLLAGHTYDVSLSVQASPAGTTVELLDGYWTVQNGSTVREAEPDIRAAYVQRSVLGSVAGNQSWQLLAAHVAVPAATAGRNGTALQLRAERAHQEHLLHAKKLRADHRLAATKHRAVLKSSVQVLSVLRTRHPPPAGHAAAEFFL